MSITATELKSNLGKYLLLAATEDIFITRNGKVVAKLSNPHQDRVDIAKSLFGILPADVTLEEAKEERLHFEVESISSIYRCMGQNFQLLLFLLITMPHSRKRS